FLCVQVNSNPFVIKNNIRFLYGFHFLYPSRINDRDSSISTFFIVIVNKKFSFNPRDKRKVFRTNTLVHTFSSFTRPTIFLIISESKSGISPEVTKIIYSNLERDSPRSAEYPAPLVSSMSIPRLETNSRVFGALLLVIHTIFENIF